jgi:hypothetical protein
VFTWTNLSCFRWIADIISRLLFVNYNIDAEFGSNSEESALLAPTGRCYFRPISFGGQLFSVARGLFPVLRHGGTWGTGPMNLWRNRTGPKIVGILGHWTMPWTWSSNLHNFVMVVLSTNFPKYQVAVDYILVSRLNLAFLFLKLSHNIDKVLVCLCPCGFDNPRNTLRWKLLQLASIHLRIILFGLRTANSSEL